MNYHQKIHSVQNFIDGNYSQDLNLQILAREACLSPFHFHRIFTAVSGETPKSYLNRIRLTQSLNILTTNEELGLTRVALEVGFSSSSRFSKAFKNHFGISPRSYLQKSKKRQVSHCQKKYAVEVKEGKSGEGYPVEETKLGEQKLVCLRVQGINGLQIAGGWIRLMAFGGQSKLLREDSIRVSIVRDNPDFTQEDTLRYDVGFSTDRKMELPAPFFEETLPAGNYLKVGFQGRRREFEAFFHWVYGKYLLETGKELGSSPAFRHYHSTGAQHMMGFFHFDYYLPLL